MITHMTIENFRSFGVTSGSKAQSFELRPFTVIVGDNSAGKSNIMRALGFATTANVNDMSRSDFFIRHGADKERKSARIRISLTSSVQKAAHEIQCEATGTDSRTFRKTFTIDGRAFPYVSRDQPATDSLLAALEPHKIFVAPTVRDITYLRTATDLLPVATRSTILSSSNKLRHALIDQLKVLCKQLSSPLAVSDITVNPALTVDELMKVIRLEFDVRDGVTIPLQNLGQGHISKAILKLAELQGKTSPICVEEPEIHVHPTGIRTLVRTFQDIVKQQGHQIIITTHSPEIVNQADFESLLSVRKEVQRSVVRQINPSLVGFTSTIQDLAQFTILRKSQRGALFLSKYVLLVEGVYDRLVLEAIDRAGDIGFLQHEVAIIDIGGDGEFSKYAKVLNHLGRPYAILLDDAAVITTDGRQPTADGVVFSELRSQGVLTAGGWPPKHISAYETAAPSKRRTMIKALDQQLAARGFSLATHGHRDIAGVVVECWRGAPLAEKVAVYRVLGGPMPNPTEQDCDAFVEKGIRKKGIEMATVAAALPAQRFRRLIQPLKAALLRLVSLNVLPARPPSKLPAQEVPQAAPAIAPPTAAEPNHSSDPGQD